MSSKLLKRFSYTIGASICIVLLCCSTALAKSRKSKIPDKFPPNPLEIKVRDSLLPDELKKEPLSPQQKQSLIQALDELNQQALIKLQSGDEKAAFDIWYRELRLRRYLGLLSEIQALSRVGEIAWRRNSSLDVRYITQRLENIQKKIFPESSKKEKQDVDIATLQALGNAFRLVRVPRNSLEIYTAVLERIRQQNNLETQISTLKTIADIHMSWFDYAEAAKAYEELLRLTSSSESGDIGINTVGNSKQLYLEELVYIYTQTQQLEKSIQAKERLIEIYSQANNRIKIPPLKIAIGSNYESLAKKNTNLLETAFQNYQEAYNIAWNLKQYIRSAEALEKLIALYRSQGQTDEALQTVQILLETQQKASNFYGMMQAYDEIGKINLQRQNYPQALAAFEQGLDIAKQIQHQQEYFTQQVNNLSGKVSN